MAVPFEVGTFPATSDVAITLGAQPLDAGEVAQLLAGRRVPFRRLRGHHRRLPHRHRDRIVLSENLNTPQVAALIAPFGATVARFFINGVETKTEGIDVVAKYVLGTERLGRFDFVAAGNWNDTEVEKVPSTNVIDNICSRAAADLHAAGAVRARQHPDLRRGHAGQQDQPGHRLEHARWAASNLGVNLKGTRYGEVVEPGVPTAAEINAGIRGCARPAHPARLAGRPRARRRDCSRTNSASRWAPTTCSTSIRIACRIDRVLPNPPGGTVNLNATNALAFSRYSPYGFSGRFLYARMSYSW